MLYTLNTLILFRPFSCCRWQQSKEEEKAIHAVPDDGAGKRVPQQFLHHAPETVGNLLQTSPHRTPGQSLVPEQTDEEKET